MPVLIDGNNLLHAARGAAPEGPLPGRTMLCTRVGEWARRRAQSVHLVFDGPAPTPDRAWQIANPDVCVSYSGGNSADAELIRILETDSAARRLLVVSSDHEIVRAAKRRRAKAIRADEFWALLTQDLERPPPVRVEPKEKHTGLGPDAAADWLLEFGFADAPEDPAT